jgi:hypothetical protein
VFRQTSLEKGHYLLRLSALKDAHHSGTLRLSFEHDGDIALQGVTQSLEQDFSQAVKQFVKDKKKRQSEELAFSHGMFWLSDRGIIFAENKSTVELRLVLTLNEPDNLFITGAQLREGALQKVLKIKPREFEVVILEQDKHELPAGLKGYKIKV